MEKISERFVLYTKKESQALQGLVRLADSKGLRLKDIHIQSANLEDVFLKLTGRSLRE